MAEFDNMRKSLPVAYRTDKWVCDLLAAIQSLDDTQREQMLDITQQLFPGSMTWALAIEERDAGLASTGTLEERRTALIARWRGSGKCDVDLIQRVLPIERRNILFLIKNRVVVGGGSVENIQPHSVVLTQKRIAFLMAQIRGNAVSACSI